MWVYKDKNISSIADIPKSAIGFVYLITTEDNKFYIGKKSLYSDRYQEVSENVYKRLKEEGQEVKKTKDKKLSKPGAPVWKYKKRVIKESDWLIYRTSNTFLKKYPLNKTKREILCFCTNKTELTYMEVFHQILSCSLHEENSLNDNILGKFFRGVLTEEYNKINKD